MRTVHLEIGINGAFLTRRWEEPENWMRLTRECGYRVHSFCGDVLDPFFSGDTGFQMEQAAAVRCAAQRYGVTLCDLYTGVATHRFHGLSHSDPRPRQRMIQWIEEAARLAVAMGAPALGGHWDAFSVETLENPQRTEAAWYRLIATFRDLAERLKSTGLASLYQEQMYIPSEKPWTLEECERFLIEVNRESKGIPVYVTLDVGHMAGVHYGNTGDDLDYVAWLQRFGAVAEVVHLQQTTPDASHHWPFTEECNRKGHIRMEAVLQALRYAHEHYRDQPFAAYVPPVKRQWLVAEIIPGSTKREDVLLEELKASAEYLYRYVPEGGVEWELDE